MIRVLYSCGWCGIKDRPVDVVERQAGQDVVHWVQQTVVHALRVDHGRQSPGCHPETLDEVKIPLAPDGSGVGFPTKQ